MATFNYKNKGLTCLPEDTDWILYSSVGRFVFIAKLSKYKQVMQFTVFYATLLICSLNHQLTN